MKIKPLIELIEEYEAVDLAENLYKNYFEASRKFNAFITLRKWEDIENDIKKITGKLKGFIIPVKDNISTKDIKTTCGSRILSNYIPPYDAFVIETLKKHGVIVAGKTNMDEFAMGNTTENSFFGPSYNPWNKEHVPGGSSGGSAITVAYKGLGALGSDTGGSIRQPAAYNYVLGLKPTYGLVSRYGLVSYGESLEQIGPFSRFSRDLALLLYILSEYDPRDITMPNIKDRVRLRESLKSYYKGVYDKNVKFRIAYSEKLLSYADSDVKRNIYRVLDYLSGYGFEINNIDLSFLEISLSTYYIIAMVEASSNLARYDGSNYGLREYVEDYWISSFKTRTRGFGEEVKRRILMGGLASSKGYENKYYIRALKLRRYIRDNMIRILKEYDFIVTPTAPSPPPKLGEATGVKGYILDLYTVSPNLSGLPAINIPTGFINGLPIGVQFIGNYFKDIELIYIAGILEDKIYNPKIMPGDD